MSDVVTSLSLDALKPHPRNEEFFSNIEGDDYKRLKESITELGVLTPLRVAADMTIISGHQRYRAAKELGLKQVPVVIDENLNEENDKLQQLIASNFGRLKNDPIKQAKWLVEYERLRGVRQGSGGDQKSNGHNVRLISQDEVANELGVDSRTIRRLKQLLDLYPEFQDMISEGRLSPTTGFKLISRLSDEEQQQLLKELPATGKVTNNIVEQCMAKIRSLSDEKREAEQRIKELESNPPRGAVRKLSKWDMAKELGITTKALENIRALNTFDPGFREIISNGGVDKYNAAKVLANLSTEDMQEVIAELPVSEVINGEMQSLREQTETANAVIEELKKEVENAGNDSEKVRELQSKIDEQNKKFERIKRENEELKSKAKLLNENVRNIEEASKPRAFESPIEEALHRTRTEFCYNVSAFDTEMQSAVIRPGDMDSFTEAERNDCIEHITSIIDSCNKILGLWSK